MLACVVAFSALLFPSRSTASAAVQTQPAWTAFSLSDSTGPWGGLVQGVDRAFYGSSWAANAIYRVSPGGGMATMYTMSGQDGSHPMGNLVQGSDGQLFGTAQNGGSPSNCGTLYALQPGGTGFTVIHGFTGTDGCNPRAGVVEGSDGYLYGTTSAGGDNGFGVVFRVARDGSDYAVLHSFAAAEGASPRSGLIQGTDGRLYGTAYGAGPHAAGSVYALQPDGLGFTVLHGFAGSSQEGGLPSGGLIQGKDGYLYGTTDSNGPYGRGTVWKLSTTSAAFTTLHGFGAPGDGATPQTELLQASDGMLYGTTHEGGAQRAGIVFRLSTTGASYANLHTLQFQGQDGGQTEAGLIQAADGTIWGTTGDGGAFNHGTVFRMNLSLPKPAPAILDFSPQSGTIGSAALIHGAYFVGTSAVSLHGTAMAYTVASGNWIQATVQAGTTTGHLSVTNTGGAAASAGVYTVGSSRPTTAIPFEFVAPGTFNWPALPGKPAHQEQGSVGVKGIIDQGAGRLTLDLYSPTRPISINAPFLGTVTRHGQTADIAITLVGPQRVGITLTNVSLAPQTLGAPAAVSIHFVSGPNAGLTVQAQATAPKVTPSEPSVVPGTTKVVTDAVAHALLLPPGETALQVDQQQGMWLRFALAAPYDAQLKSVKVGDVLVSGATPKAPNGFVRKVVSVSLSYGTIGFWTTPGTITDAISQGGFHLQKTLVGTSLHSAVWKDSARVRRSNDATTSLCLNLNANIQSTPQLNNNVNGLNGLVAVQSQGNLCFDISLDISASWSLSQPNIVSVSATPSIQMHGQQTIQLSGGAQVDSHINIWRTPLGVIPFAIGPVPVTITPILNLKVGAQGQIQASLTIGAVETGGVSSTLTCRVDFKDLLSSGCTSTSTSNPAIQVTVNSSVQVQAQAYFGPDLWFAFYGLAGPDVGVQAYLQAQFDTSADPCMQMYAGLQLWATLHLAPTDPTKLLDLGEDGTDLFQVILLDIHPIGPRLSWRCTTPWVNGSPLPAGEVSVPYSQALKGFGGTTPYTWSLASGPLPPGLTLDSSGMISGTPSQAGSFPFTVKITDKAGSSSTYSFTLNIQGAPAVTTSSLPNAMVGLSYNANLSASGGAYPYRYEWSQVPASGCQSNCALQPLPPGLQLSSDGSLTGPPTQTGQYTFAVQAIDRLGGRSPKVVLTLTVGGPALAVTTDSSDLTAYCRSGFGINLQAINGQSPYGWKLVGSTPAWLTLRSDGWLHASPPLGANPNYTFTVQVTDHAGATATKNLVLSVECDRDPPKSG